MEDGDRVRFTFEGAEIAAPEGASLAAALLAAGVADFGARPGSGGGRGPFCLMGSCFDCLVVVDGRENVLACMTPVRAGTEVRRMAHLPASGQRPA